MVVLFGFVCFRVLSLAFVVEVLFLFNIYYSLFALCRFCFVPYKLARACFCCTFIELLNLFLFPDLKGDWFGLVAVLLILLTFCW
jgi:hypothetical protein